MPKIETPRLILRKMVASDTEALWVLFTNPLVMASFGGTLLDLPQMQRWVQRNLEHQEQYGYGLFSLIHKADGRLIGNCGLEHMEMEGRQETELGYDLRSDYWNQGLATEAATAVRDYAFHILRLPRLISLIRTGNTASQHVAEKIGMVLTEESIRGGTPYWIYSIPNRETDPP